MRDMGLGPVYLHDNHGLLHDVADTGADEVEQDIHTTLSPRLDLDCCLSYSLDTSAYKVHVDFRSVSEVSPSTPRGFGMRKGTVLLQLAQ